MEKKHQHSTETENQEPGTSTGGTLVPALVLVCEQLTVNQQKIWLKPRSPELVPQSQKLVGRRGPTGSAGTPPAPPGPRPWTPG